MRRSSDLPEGWARAVAAAAGRWQADKVVAEVNNGGAMVTSVLRSVDPLLPVKAVRASHGKVTRAEPVAALYVQGRSEEQTSELQSLMRISYAVFCLIKI